MSFLRTTDRVFNANHLGQLGDVTSDDVGKWLTVGSSLFSAAAPLIQTFVPTSAQAQIQQFVGTLNKTVNPVAVPPQPPPPAIQAAQQQTGWSIPAWAPLAAVAALAAYVFARGGGSRRRNPAWSDPTSTYRGFAINPRRRRHARMKIRGKRRPERARLARLLGGSSLGRHMRKTVRGRMLVLSRTYRRGR